MLIFLSFFHLVFLTNFRKLFSRQNLDISNHEDDPSDQRLRVGLVKKQRWIQATLDNFTRGVKVVLRACEMLLQKELHKEMQM